MERTKQKVAILSHLLPNDFIIATHLDGMTEKIKNCRDNVLDVTRKAETQLKFDAHLKRLVELLPGQNVSTEVLGCAYDFIKTNSGD